ncbi:MAG: type II toxin-antitoxin system YoeB family toxin [Holosporales bacterium]|jgi:toxin YoeB|nr:type II toxin-antitoxin system YoeB family toxin [Holosporales bacterium]
MSCWEFSFTRLFIKQKTFLKKNDAKFSERLGFILLSMRDTPRDGLGKPERLKYKDREIWSRRLDKKNRAVIPAKVLTLQV